jgi:hypothetical protein
MVNDEPIIKYLVNNFWWNVADQLAEGLEYDYMRSYIKDVIAYNEDSLPNINNIYSKLRDTLLSQGDIELASDDDIYELEGVLMSSKFREYTSFENCKINSGYNAKDIYNKVGLGKLYKIRNGYFLLEFNYTWYYLKDSLLVAGCSSCDGATKSSIFVAENSHLDELIEEQEIEFRSDKNNLVKSWLVKSALIK